MARRPKRDDHFDERERILFARSTRLIIRLIAIGLGAYVTYLQIKQIRIEEIITPATPDLMWRGALILYYWSWIFGAGFDTNVVELTFVNFPGKGKWPWHSFGALAVILVMAVVLISAHGNMLHFALALTAFTIVDNGPWFYYFKWLLRPMALQSRTEFKGNGQLARLEALRIVLDLVLGNWKYWRLACGAIIILILDAFTFSTFIRQAFARLTDSILSWLSPAEAADFVYASLVLLFVLVMEGWHWIMRFMTLIKLRAIHNIDEHYVLKPP